MYDSKQEEAFIKSKDCKGMFITGSGGVGKTYTTKKIIDSKRGVAVCSPTGIGALNIGGVTCNKLFGLPLHVPNEYDFVDVPRKVREVLEYTSTIVIDEIGMLRTDYFELIDNKLRIIKNSDEPFGGVQIIGVGDFYQIEPVVSAEDSEEFNSLYRSPFCFTSSKWNLEMIELDTVHRQADAEQIAMLNNIRKGGKLYNRDLMRIQHQAHKFNRDDKDLIILCNYNIDADEHNKLKFNQLSTPIKTFAGYTNGNYTLPKIVDENLNLRLGCKVVICANDPVGNFVNGDRGTVVKINQSNVVVQLLNGNLVTVEYFTWEQSDYKAGSKSLEREIVGSYTQLPIKLGWAISVHKSQGMTLDKVAYDKGKRGCFAHGQLYTALSRIRDLRDMSFLRSVTPRDLIINDKVSKFYDNGGKYVF